MADWVDCTGAFNYTRGWAADMGPYTGPWPLLPPAVIDAGADTRPEFDFYVMLPNPADTTDVTTIGDGSYDTPLWDTYRFQNFPGSDPATGFDYFGDYVGPSAPQPIPPTPPAGVHLYVVYYPSGGHTGPPPNPPAYYVPASYAAGGAAAFETAMGHWSSVLEPAYSATRTIPGIGSIGGHAAGYEAGGEVVSEIIKNDPTYDPVAADQNIATVANSLIGTLLASTPTSGSGVYRIEGSKGNDGPRVGLLGGDAGSGVRLAGTVGLVLFDGTALLDADTPPVPTGFRWDEDYSDTPYIDSTGNSGNWFQHTAAAAFAWQTMLYSNDETNTTGYTGYADGLPFFPHSGVDSSPLGVNWRAVWAAGLDATTTPTWTYTGTTLGDFAPDGGAGTSIDISGITSISFSLHWAPEFLYTSALPGAVADFAMPPGNGSQPNNQGFADTGFGDFNSPVLQVDYGPWRYWVPGAIVPAAAVPVATYLRMTQRGDGLGLSPAPRIAAGQVRSEQGAALRRVGGANTFI